MSLDEWQIAIRRQAAGDTLFMQSPQDILHYLKIRAVIQNYGGYGKEIFANSSAQSRDPG